MTRDKTKSIAIDLRCREATQRGNDNKLNSYWYRIRRWIERIVSRFMLLIIIACQLHKSRGSVASVFASFGGSSHTEAA